MAPIKQKKPKKKSSAEKLRVTLPQLMSAAKTSLALGRPASTLSVWRSVKRYPELKYTRIGHSIMSFADSVASFIKAGAVDADGTEVK